MGLCGGLLPERGGGRSLCTGPGFVPVVLSVPSACLQPPLPSHEQFSLGQKDWLEHGDVFSNKDLIKNG